jgi:serine/threonine protein kinase
MDETHSEAALDLIYACLNPNPNLRPKIEEIMNNEWIKSAPKELD